MVLLSCSGGFGFHRREVQGAKGTTGAGDAASPQAAVACRPASGVGTRMGNRAEDEPTDCAGRE